MANSERSVTNRLYRRFLGDGQVVLVFMVIGLACSCCRANAKQIVLARDEFYTLTEADLNSIIRGSLQSNISIAMFTSDQNMSFADLILAATDWLNKDNSTVIVDTTSVCRIAAVANLKRIPILRISLMGCSDINSDVINVRPALKTYISAGFSFLQDFGSCLARVVLLVEYTAELTEFPKCCKGTAVPLLSRFVGAWPLTEEQTNQTQTWLKGVASRSALHYMTIVGSGNFLNGIIELGWLELLPPSFQWIFVATDSTSFNCSECRHPTPFFQHSQEPLLPFPFPFTSQANRVQSYYTWKAVQLVVDMDFTDSVSTSPGDKMSIHSTNLTLDVQLFKGNNTREDLGSWTEEGGLQIDNALRESLYNPAVVRVAVLESPPFVFRVKDENGTHYEGYAVDVLQEVAQRLQLRFRFTDSEQDKFGVRLPNGSWNGIIGDIMSGLVDIAVGALTVTAEREEVVDFTTPFYEFAGIEILVKEVHKKKNLLFFVTVFSEPMWGAWFGVLLLTGFLLAAFDYLSPFSSRNSRGSGGDGGSERRGSSGDVEEDTDRDTFDLKEGLWLVTASFTQTGPESTPRTLSSRVLVAGFWFFCTIIMANYTANLAAFLTTSRLSTPINSLQDLAAQSKVRYSVVRGTTTMSYFERMAKIESNFYELWKNISSNLLTTGDLAKSELAVWEYPLGDTYVKIWTDMKKTGLLSSSQEGLDKVIQGNFALIDEAPYLQYAISQHCDLTTIGKQFSTKSYAFALPQGSPLNEQVSNCILKLQSETILEKLKQKWWHPTAQGCAVVDESDGLSFHTLGGVFLLAGVGVAAGLLLCGLEMVWAWLGARRRKKSQMSHGHAVTSRTDLVQEFNLENSVEGTNADDDRYRVDMSKF